MKDLITVDGICARYHCERHKASRIMYSLPFFRVGNRLFAYASDLEEWERGQMVYPIAKGVKKTQQIPFLIPRKRA